MEQKLALLGGPKLAKKDYFFHTTDTGEEELLALKEVIDSQVLSGFIALPGKAFYGGEKVLAFEKQFSSRLDVRHAVSFNSATSALHAAISASGIGPGDEVITSPFTMSATASSILMQNGLPVFADINEDDFTISPSAVEKKLGPATRAILAVNLFGQPADLFKLRDIARKNRLILIEDNSQAPLATLNGQYTGTIGDMGVFSFNYHKAIQCGEGGIVVTNNDYYYEKLCLVRNHGECSVKGMGVKFIENTLGWNYRMTELQAAVAMVQLGKLDRLNDIRVSLAEYLLNKLQSFDFLIPPFVRTGCEHKYYFFPVKYCNTQIGIHRDTFVRALQCEGFPAGSGYVEPIYFQPLYQKQIVYGRKGCPFNCKHVERIPDYHIGLCPVTEKMYHEELIVFKICRFPHEKDDIDLFVKAIEKIIENKEKLREWEKQNL